MELSNSSYSTIRPASLSRIFNVSSLRNITGHVDSDEPFTTQQLIRIFTVTIVIYPILLTCCTVGNILSFIVLLREKRKGSTNIYMTSMVISDFLILWLYFPPYLYNASISLRRTPWFSKAFHQIYGPQVWLQETFIQQSDWTLVLFSLARLCAIVQPFRWQWAHDAQITRRTVITLAFLSAVFTLNNVVKLSYLDSHHIDITHAPSWLIEWSEMQHQAEVVVTLLKVALLVIINLAVLMALRRQHAVEIGETLGDQQSTPNNRKYKNSNYILLGSVAMYLITQAPSVIVNCLMIAADDYGTFHLPNSMRIFINPFVAMSYFSAYSMNFLLYLAVSERFRSQFGQMFGQKWGLRAVSSHSTGSIRSQQGRNGKPDNGFFNMAQAFQSSRNNLQLQDSTRTEVQVESQSPCSFSITL